MNSSFKFQEIVISFGIFLPFRQTDYFFTRHNNHTSFAQKQFLQESSLDVNNLAIFSELSNDFSNFFSLAMMKEVVQNIQDSFFFFVCQFFS